MPSFIKSKWVGEVCSVGVGVVYLLKLGPKSSGIGSVSKQQDEPVKCEPVKCEPVKCKV